MVKILRYGYACGIFRPRKLAIAYREDNARMQEERSG
jgi:hypothetical protein